jgi:hypothetical protein
MKKPNRHDIRSRIVLTILAVIGITVGLTGAAQAGSTTDPSAVFAKQVADAGLTAQQAKGLQAKIDRYLAKYGGTQVSASRIEFADGGGIIVTVPGERYARDLATQRSIASTWSCSYYYFCAFQNTYYQGEQRYEDTCNDLEAIPWVTEGSYVNNQTSGTRARFVGSGGQTLGYSEAAFAAVPSGVNWLPIWWFDPC